MIWTWSGKWTNCSNFKFSQSHQKCLHQAIVFLFFAFKSSSLILVCWDSTTYCSFLPSHFIWNLFCWFSYKIDDCILLKIYQGWSFTLDDVPVIHYQQVHLQVSLIWFKSFKPWCLDWKFVMWLSDLSSVFLASFKA